MIIIDVNLLIYAYNDRSPQYANAKRWLEEAISSGEAMGVPMQSILAFIRISTNSQLPGPHSSVELAIATIDALLQISTVTVLHPGPRHWEIFQRLCLDVGAGGNLSTDAHFAALAIEHNALLCSADSDFARFPGLRWHNPLAGL